MISHKEIRKKYLEFFKKPPRNHKEIPSSPLMPENDPTTLFTSSGMQPLIPYLLGEPHPLGNRLVDSQKSFRAQDIDEVGDNRHTTFFEMLGNWSLGEYFKKEQLHWFFEFLTKVLNLDPNQLYVTVFEGNEDVPKDTESIEIWKEIFDSVGIKAREGERIFTYPAKKNWWSRSGPPEDMPAGEPGGPDSEVFFEFKNVSHHPKFGKVCHPNCDCGRFLEIGNSVFMQYQKQQDGSLKELPKKNVDFGGGLERLTAAVNNEPDIFKTDVFFPIIQNLQNASNKSYSGEFKSPMRIIADHLKASTFMLSEGLIPSNKYQGYVLRRLIRRSVVKMHQLKLTDSFTQMAVLVAESVGNIYKDYYTDLDPKKPIFENIRKTLSEEITKFEKTLHKGLKILDKHSKITGQLAFDLMQSFGFPWELTAELAKEKGQEIDRKEFEREFERHRHLSRTTGRGIFRGGLQDQSQIITKLHTATHLLQQSLRDVLGNHVRQKGSNITAERLRFDFTHNRSLTSQQLSQVEKIVNTKIRENLKVTMQILDFHKALQTGALTVPDIKYPEKVKVYSIGNFSKEVCGGPHIDFTGKLGKFKIVKEEGVSNSVRRIYAVLSDKDVSP